MDQHDDILSAWLIKFDQKKTTKWAHKNSGSFRKLLKTEALFCISCVICLTYYIWHVIKVLLKTVHGEIWLQSLMGCYWSSGMSIKWLVCESRQILVRASAEKCQTLNWKPRENNQWVSDCWLESIFFHVFQKPRWSQPLVPGAPSLFRSHALTPSLTTLLTRWNTVINRTTPDTPTEKEKDRSWLSSREINIRIRLMPEV